VTGVQTCALPILGHEKVSITQIYLQNMQDAQIVENAVNRSVIASLKKS